MNLTFTQMSGKGFKKTRLSQDRFTIGDGGSPMVVVFILVVTNVKEQVARKMGRCVST